MMVASLVDMMVVKKVGHSAMTMDVLLVVLLVESSVYLKVV